MVDMGALIAIILEVDSEVDSEVAAVAEEE